MSFPKKIPWLSLSLLLLVDINLGWVLYQSAALWWVWLVTISCILLVAEVLASPWALIRTFTNRWLQSDARAFLTIILSAFCAVLILAWFHIAAHLLLLIVAASIARLDLQEADLKDVEAFFILAILSLSGLSIGWIMYRLYAFLLEFLA